MANDATVRCRAVDIRRPMGGARAILKTRFGPRGCCRLRWVAARDEAELLTTDGDRLSRVRFPATLKGGTDVDWTVPFEAVRTLANWRQAEVLIRSRDGCLIVTGTEEKAREQKWTHPTAFTTEMFQRALDRADEASAPIGQIKRAPTARALQRRPGTPNECIVTVAGEDAADDDAPTNGGPPRIVAAGTGGPGTGSRSARVNRKHLRDTLRTMTGCWVQMTFATGDAVRIRSMNDREHFLLVSTSVD